MLGELDAGFRLGSRYRENTRALEEFLEQAYVQVDPITADVARRYGETFERLKRAGTPIPTNDIWIAAATFDRGAHLVTFDRDFAHVADLAHTVFTAA